MATINQFVKGQNTFGDKQYKELGRIESYSSQPSNPFGRFMVFFALAMISVGLLFVVLGKLFGV